MSKKGGGAEQEDRVINVTMSSTEPTAVVDSAEEMTADNFVSLERGDDLEIRLDVSDFVASPGTFKIATESFGGGNSTILVSSIKDADGNATPFDVELTQGSSGFMEVFSDGSCWKH